jgi:hypothetical protein
MTQNSKPGIALCALVIAIFAPTANAQSPDQERILASVVKSVKDFNSVSFQWSEESFSRPNAETEFVRNFVENGKLVASSGEFVIDRVKALISRDQVKNNPRQHKVKLYKSQVFTLKGGSQLIVSKRATKIANRNLPLEFSVLNEFEKANLGDGNSSIFTNKDFPLDDFIFVWSGEVFNVGNFGSVIQKASQVHTIESEWNGFKSVDVKCSYDEGGQFFFRVCPELNHLFVVMKYQLSGIHIPAWLKESGISQLEYSASVSKMSTEGDAFQLVVDSASTAIDGKVERNKRVTELKNISFDIPPVDGWDRVKLLPGSPVDVFEEPHIKFEWRGGRVIKVRDSETIRNLENLAFITSEDSGVSKQLVWFLFSLLTVCVLLKKNGLRTQ